MAAIVRKRAQWGRWGDAEVPNLVFMLSNSFFVSWGNHGSFLHVPTIPGNEKTRH